jgi:hypothetical protein
MREFAGTKTRTATDGCTNERCCDCSNLSRSSHRNFDRTLVDSAMNEIVDVAARAAELADRLFAVEAAMAVAFFSMAFALGFCWALDLWDAWRARRIRRP